MAAGAEKVVARDVRDAESKDNRVAEMRPFVILWNMLRRYTIVLSILAGLFMMLDGVKAIVTGGYIAPGGQIGPWAGLVNNAGISPFSPGMKAAFVVLGVAYIISALAYAFYRPGSRTFLAAVAILTLWYLPIGTVISIIVLTSVAFDRSGIR